MYLTPPVEQLITLALDEDLSAGDLTTDAIFTAADRTQGEVLAKSPLVLAGSWVFEAVMRRMSPDVRLTWQIEEGQPVEARTVLASISGPTAAILRGERTALNFLQRMCGVATLTRRYAAALEGSSAEVVDTRKTIPGWRALDKYAVRCGGGRNHRFNLGSGVMLKDNHIAASGSITAAVAKARALAPHTLRVEVEIDSLEQLNEAVDAGADILLLDNMDDATTARCVELARARAGARPLIIEASGGVTLERLPRLAATGVDIISVGALTHSAVAADISLDLRPA